jgi:hypothetical protein
MRHGCLFEQQLNLILFRSRFLLHNINIPFLGRMFSICHHVILYLCMHLELNSPNEIKKEDYACPSLAKDKEHRSQLPCQHDWSQVTTASSDPLPDSVKL